MQFFFLIYAFIIAACIMFVHTNKFKLRMLSVLVVGLIVRNLQMVLRTALQSYEGD